MSTFDETLHPRRPSGRFAAKSNTAPQAGLAAPIPDPFAHTTEFPVTDEKRTVFVEATTFSEIDDAYARQPSDLSFSDKMLLRWAGVARGRELRHAGDAGIPTQLNESNPFAHTQNDVELYEMFSQITEEPPGDGEMSSGQWTSWVLRVTDQYNARRTELSRAGAVGAYRM